MLIVSIMQGLSISAHVQGRGLVSVSAAAALTPANAERLFKAVADPAVSSKAFRSQENCSFKLVHQDHNTRRYEMDCIMPWRVLTFKGEEVVHTLWEVDLANMTVTFKLREPGFMKVFEGVYTFHLGNDDETGASSRLQYNFSCQSKLVPPRPFYFMLQRSVTKQVRSSLTEMLQWTQNQQLARAPSSAAFA